MVLVNPEDLEKTYNQTVTKSSAKMDPDGGMCDSYEPKGEVIGEEDKALAMVRASVGPGLMTGKTKKPKLTSAQKAAAQKASDNYQKKTSEHLHSSPRD